MLLLFSLSLPLSLFFCLRCTRSRNNTILWAIKQGIIYMKCIRYWTPHIHLSVSRIDSSVARVAFVSAARKVFVECWQCRRCGCVPVRALNERRWYCLAAVHSPERLLHIIIIIITPITIAHVLLNRTKSNTWLSPDVQWRIFSTCAWRHSQDSSMDSMYQSS